MVAAGGAVETARTYEVVYQRDETGWWQARVREISGCHTQGRTVDEAKRRIREALSLFVDDADRAELRDNVKLPSSVTKMIESYRKQRERADAESRKASEAAVHAVEALLAQPLQMSLRDAASLLDLSHQRVFQLHAAASHSTRPAGAKKAARRTR
jgi:predicted RNase H-like HicB family nuclease